MKDQHLVSGILGRMCKSFIQSKSKKKHIMKAQITTLQHEQ